MRGLLGSGAGCRSQPGTELKNYSPTRPQEPGKENQTQNKDSSDKGDCTG